ncbi:MAG: site-specific integrase [Desulfatitalea sp.]
MVDKGRAERTIRLALDMVRQVFNFAATNGIYSGANPAAGKVKRPNADNRRVRYLTEAEADTLLVALKEKSPDTHDQALLSLNTGLRAGEIFSLTWADVNFEDVTLLIKDTKSGRNRHAFMTERVRDMLKARPEGKPGNLVFPNMAGGRIKQVSNSFDRVVDELKFNEGITDRRQRLTFHCCRHTFASRLVERGVDIYHVKELLGHQTIELTARYSHLSPASLRAAVDVLEKRDSVTEPPAVADKTA